MIDPETQSIEINGTEYHAEYARITNAFLGYQHHGIFTAYLTFVGEGWTQSEPAQNRTPDQLEEYIIALLNTLAIREWNSIINNQVIVLRKSMLSQIVGIINPKTEQRLFFTNC